MSQKCYFLFPHTHTHTHTHKNQENQINIKLWKTFIIIMKTLDVRKYFYDYEFILKRIKRNNEMMK